MTTLDPASPSAPQRRAQRLPIVAAAEIVALDTDTGFDARTSDLSLVGCYLDIPNPLPVGTEIKVRLAHQNETFTARGIVASSESNLGMGISFTSIENDQRYILERWLSGARDTA